MRHAIAFLAFEYETDVGAYLVVRGISSHAEMDAGDSYLPGVYGSDITARGSSQFGAVRRAVYASKRSEPGGIAAFDRFVEFTHALADALSAGIVDDNRQPLDEAGLGRIRAQLQALYTSMEQQGIPAGGSLALRLFS